MRRLALLAGLLLAGVFGCGQPGGAKGRQFVVVVHNLDVAYPETATAIWWHGSSVVGSATEIMPAGGTAVFFMGGGAPGRVRDRSRGVALGDGWRGLGHAGLPRLLCLSRRVSARERVEGMAVNEDEWPPRDPDFDFSEATDRWPSKPAGPDGPERAS